MCKSLKQKTSNYKFNTSTLCSLVRSTQKILEGCQKLGGFKELQFENKDKKKIYVVFEVVKSHESHESQ